MNNVILGITATRGQAKCTKMGLIETLDMDLIIAFLSDTVATQVLYDEDLAIEVLKVAEKKVNHLKTLKAS